MANVGQTSVTPEKHGQHWTVRVWKDGKHTREKVCPVSGPGALSKVERGKKVRQIVDEANSKASLPDVLPEEGKNKITFKEAAERWLKERQNPRKDGLLKDNTIRLYRHYLVRWIYPVVGDLPLAQVRNVQAEQVIDRMFEQKSSTSVQADTFNIITQVVASVTDSDYQPIFDVQWNWKAIKSPDVPKKEMKAFTAEQVERILNRAPGQYRTLFALLAASGLREGEAAAIEINGDNEKVTTLSKDCRVLYVNSILLQRNTIQDSPKTPAGRRQVDLHPDIAQMLLAEIADRAKGFLFCANSGNPLSYANIYKNVLDPILYDTERKIMKRQGKGWKQVGVKKIAGVVGPPETEGYGFHSFRRFRNTFLVTEVALPDAYVKYWLGHHEKGMTELYTKIKENMAKRKELCEKAGLGFHLPKVAEIEAVKSNEEEKTA